METELDDFAAWMEVNDHEPRIIDDYGGEVIECRNRKCLATQYDWENTHINAFRKSRP